MRPGWLSHTHSFARQEEAEVNTENITAAQAVWQGKPEEKKMNAHFKYICRFSEQRLRTKIKQNQGRGRSEPLRKERSSQSCCHHMCAGHTWDTKCEHVQNRCQIITGSSRTHCIIKKSMSNTKKATTRVCELKILTGLQLSNSPSPQNQQS